MTSKRNDTGKGGRRSGRSRRKLHTFYLAAIAALGIALVAVLMLGNREGGASAEQIAGATGTLSAASTFYDFGRVSMRDGVVTYPFRLRNTGSEPALIRKLYTS